MLHRLAIRLCDHKIVGIIDLRHHIDHPILSVWGGHIGYTVNDYRTGVIIPPWGVWLRFPGSKGLLETAKIRLSNLRNELWEHALISVPSCNMLFHVFQRAFFQPGDLGLADTDFLGHLHLCLPLKKA